MEYNYVNIREVLSRILRHPLLQELTLEAAIQYTIDFIGIVGMPNMFKDKIATIHIEKYRGVLPCDLIEITQVRESKSHISLRSTTDSFYQDDSSHKRMYDLTFKTQGRVIIVSFETGDIDIAYRALPIDDEGYPLLLDIPTFLKALELYIKKEYFTILFDMQKISQQALMNTEQNYAWAVGQLNADLTIPTISEMESISNIFTSLVIKTTEFKDGFIKSGNKEFIKNH